MLASFVAAVRFLTRLPVPGPPTRGDQISRSVGWFPLVGALVGLATAGVHVLGLGLWPAPLAAVLAVAFGLMLTGGFHEDGATDAADGLGGGWTRERMLEIMKDSRIGAYGAMALWVLLSFRWAALVALDRRALLALPLAMAWGRWSSGALIATLPPLGQGLAKEVSHDLGRGPLLGSCLLLVVLNLLAMRLGMHDLWRPAAAAGITILAWGAYLRQSLGGQSGDLLGAGNQLVEAAVLLTLLAK